jgi:predicted DNA-binding transcriptional regulator YafY
MNRTDRIYAIREELRLAGERGRTAEQLSDTFGVSVRTVKRDIRSLQLGGFPVWAVPGPGGGYVVDAQATLPPVNLNATEVAGLCAAIALLGGQPFAMDARAALSKILAEATPEVRRHAQRVAGRVWVNHAEEVPGADERVQRTLEEALSQRRTLSVRYLDRDGNATQRRVDPQLLARTSGAWYLVAYCHMREGIRWFRLDRIDGAYLTAQASRDRDIAEIGTPPDTSEAVWRGGE